MKKYRPRNKAISTGKRVTVQERDILWFAFLHRHGERLPTAYLNELTTDDFTNYQSTQKRLTDLFHEGNTPHRSHYLSRPVQQFNLNEDKKNDIVYQNTRQSLDILKSHSLWSEYAPNPRGFFAHQLMASSITASFELGAKANGLRYIPQHTILERAGVPLYVEIDGGLHPDALFGLDMDGVKTYYFLEVDRGTEPFTSTARRKTWSRNVEQYQKLIGKKEYKKIFRLEGDWHGGAFLLNITITPGHRKAMTKVVDKHFRGGCPYILSHSISYFGEVVTVPPIMDMYDTYYERAGHPPYKIGGA